MATSYIPLSPASAILPDGSASNLAPAITRNKGTDTAPAKHYLSLDFDPTNNENAWWTFRMPGDYASAPIAVVQWVTTVATAANVIWGAKLGAVTAADADTPAEHAMAAASTTTTANNTTEAGRLIESSITIANTDSVAAGDLVFLLIYRDAASASDTLTAADAKLLAVEFQYTTV